LYTQIILDYIFNFGVIHS